MEAGHTEDPHTHVPGGDLVHDLGEHLLAGVREDPVYLAGGVEGVAGAVQRSQEHVPLGVPGQVVPGQLVLGHAS